MHDYGEAEYWEKRYNEQEGKTFDWLEDWSSLKHIITSLISPSASVLMLGCGNAEMSEEMHGDGFTSITNIDLSSTVINQMQERCGEKEGMTWQVMDVRSLDFPGASFDMAIDKSTIDALLCGDNAYSNVALMTREVQRVLKTGGYYVVISYGVPDTRMEHFQRPHLLWDVAQVKLGEGESAHFVYICQKKPGADLHSEENWGKVQDCV